jgi:two-component system response regulator RegA
MTPKRILVVDDDPTFSRYLVAAFADRGYIAFGANYYDAAMNAVADGAPDFAVVDLKLGAESGLSLLRDILRASPTTRIVVLTGYGSIATAVRAVRLGAKDYLSKPANADDLLAAFEHGGTELDAKEDSPGNSPTLADAEWEHIQRILADCAGNITHAAERLGVHRRSLQRKLNRGRG